MSGKQKTRTPGPAWIDWLRILASFLVVLVHAASQAAYSYQNVPRDSWEIANVWAALARICVPLFVLLSGYLLLDPSKTEATGSFYKKRVLRLLPPFLFWSALFLVWRLVERGETFGPQHLLLLVSSQTYVHLWYLPMLVGLYLVTPLLRGFLRGASAADQRWLVAVWAVLIVGGGLFTRLTGAGVNHYLSTLPAYAGLYLLGWMTRDLVLRTRGQKLLAGAVFAAAFAFTAVAASVGSADRQTLDEYWYYFLSPNVLAMSMAAWLLLKSIGAGQVTTVAVPPRRLTALRSDCADSAFGIYLFHFIPLYAFMWGWFGFKLSWHSIHPAIGIPLLSLAAWSVSWGVAALCRRVPLLKRLWA